MLMSILFSGFTKSNVHCCEQRVLIGRNIFHDVKYPGDCCMFTKATNVDAQI